MNVFIEGLFYVKKNEGQWSGLFFGGMRPIDNTILGFFINNDIHIRKKLFFWTKIGKNDHSVLSRQIDYLSISFCTKHVLKWKS